MDVRDAPLAQDTLHAEVTDALSRGLVTQAEVAGLTDAELGALVALCRDALSVGETGRALTLARALVVLSPFWAVAWRLLAQTLQAQGQEQAAAYALQAVSLLTPREADRPQQEPTPAPHEPVAIPNSQGAAPLSGSQTLLLHDGRPLPLTHTPAAQHHDTAAAKRAAVALMGASSRGNTAQWAQTTQEHAQALPLPDTGVWPLPGGRTAALPPEALVVTGTAVVRRPVVASASDGDDKAPDATGKIFRPAPARAAARRRLGWPITDTWSPDEPTHTAITPRG